MDLVRSPPGPLDPPKEEPNISSTLSSVLDSP